MKENEDSDTAESLEENHQGRNAQRIRVYLGMKQEVFAKELGVSQSQVSSIEQQPVIEEQMLAEIAGVLGVTPELIKNFDVARAIYNINHYKDSTIHGNFKDTTISENGIGYQYVNPLEKVVELYERLLKSEREKLELFLKNKDNA
jgi:transcriptional regulator with XRE-family HTH domain